MAVNLDLNQAKIFRTSMSRINRILITICLSVFGCISLFLLFLLRNDPSDFRFYLWVCLLPIWGIFVVTFCWRQSIKLEVNSQFILRTSMFGKEMIANEDVYGLDWCVNMWKTQTTGGLCVFDRQLNPRIYIMPELFPEDMTEITMIFNHLVINNNPNPSVWIIHGMFFGWLIDNSLLNPSFESSLEDKVISFKQRRLTGYQILGMNPLTANMLTEEALRFTVYCWHSPKGERILNRSLAPLHQDRFTLIDSWSNYEIISQIFSELYYQREGSGGFNHSFLAP